MNFLSLLGGGQQEGQGGLAGMLGGLSGGLAEQLGYKNMAIKKKSGPPTQELLPSQAAHEEFGHGVQTALGGLASQQPTMMNNSPDLHSLLSFHAQGGKLNPNKINIVGENGPEAVVDGQVLPLKGDLPPLADIPPPPVKRLLDDGDGPDSEGPTDDDTHAQDQRPIEPPAGQAAPQMSQEGALRQQIDQTLQQRVKRSPWADAGVALVQAGDNWFNHKNEPIKTWNEMKADRALGSLAPRYKMAQDAAAAKQAQDYQNARVRDMETNRNIQQATLDDRTEYQRNSLTDKQKTRDANAQNLKMRLIARQWEGVKGGYNPSDPRFAELTKGLGDVNLPITPKDAKKNVKMEQDAETGAWYTTLTDPFTGEQETRPITTKDGEQLVTTSSSKVAADAATNRQTSQQTFQSTENQKNRDQRKQEFLMGYQNNISTQLRALANDAQKQAEWRLGEIRRIESDKDIPEDVKQQMLGVLGNQ